MQDFKFNTFSCNDYISFNDFMAMNKEDTVRREFCDGHVVRSASASAKHQDLVGEISAALRNFLRGKTCREYPGRDVHLKTSHGDVLYVPDVVVLCDKSKDNGQTIEGAPDFVLEIWSPSNLPKDRKRKREDYMHAGVREIWEMSGKDTEWSLIIHTLRDSGDYLIDIAQLDAPVSFRIFEGCSVDLWNIIKEN